MVAEGQGAEPGPASAARRGSLSAPSTWGVGPTNLFGPNALGT